MFGEQHRLVRKTGSAKIAWGLSLPQIVALLVGGQLSYKLSQVIPSLPIKNFAFAHVHHALPLVIVALLAFAREGRTGLNYALYVYYAIMFRLRRRVYVWRR